MPNIRNGNAESVSEHFERSGVGNLVYIDDIRENYIFLVRARQRRATKLIRNL